MLLWQHKNKLKSYFCLQLIGFVIALHMIVLICVFVQSNVDYDELHVIASVSYDLGADVVVVPFKKIAEQPEVQEPATLPTIKETTIAEIPKVKPKPVEKKEEVTQPKPEKKEVETLPKKVDAVTKDVAKQDVEKKPPIAPKQVTPEKVTPKRDSSKVQKPFDGLPSMPKGFAGHSRAGRENGKREISTKELRALNIQQAIAHQVNMHWQPPEGFADSTQATIEITLTYKGEIGAIDMKESSGVLAFDIHARSALYAMQFPRACWGKKITITFS